MYKHLVFMMMAVVAFAACGDEFDKESCRKLWDEASRGKNLAAGRPFAYSRIPGYRLTHDDKDPYDLTDGKLATYKNDCIWFDRKSVGWYDNAAANGVNLLMDLGQEERIGKVVIRLLGGAQQSTLVFPKQIAVYVSRDGRDYYQTMELQKLMPGEKDQSDFKKYFYLPEEGKAYVYPFPLEVNAEARYVMIRIHAEANSIFSDQAVILEAGAGAANFNAAYQTSPRQLPMRGIVAGPRCGIFAVPSNMSAPNALSIDDMRDPANAKETPVLEIDLPRNIVLEKSAVEPSDAGREGYHRYRLPVKNAKRPEMLYFRAVGEVPEGAAAAIQVICGDEPVWRREYPVQVIVMPEVKPALVGIPVDLSWMGEGAQAGWPNFLNDWHKLGFDAVTCFPRYSKTPEAQSKLRGYLASARAKGYKVVMNESPFHEMIKNYGKHQEIYSQRTDGKPSKDLCPSYQGEYYRKELERVSAMVKMAEPDRIYWDIECWNNGAEDALRGRCIRCNEAVKASGVEVEKYLRQCGVRIMTDLKEAVRAGSGDRPMPLIGSYNHHAAYDKPHHHLFAGLEVFPGQVDQLQPSLYVAGRAELVHKSIRANYLNSNSRKIFPWLTAGTYGEFEPAKMEPMIYEAMLNGAQGFGYYCFTDFDTPLDFYYHAKALATLAPYQEILKNGKVWLGEGTNKELYYSGLHTDDSMLLLVGNYNKAAEETSVKPPLNPRSAVDLISGQTIPAASEINLQVPKGQFRLLYLKK